MTHNELVAYYVGLAVISLLVISMAVRKVCAWQEPPIPVIDWKSVSHLKTHPEFFFHVFLGTKAFELRKNDRGFKLGQVWYLREWVPPPNGDLPGYYKGSWVKVGITYLIEHEPEGIASGVAPGYCVFGFSVLEKYDFKLNLHLRGKQCLPTVW